MRWSELKGLDWILPAARNKVKADLVRPLSVAALAALVDGPRIEARDFVFRPLRASAKLKRELDERSGVTGWVLHDLRRTARSLMSRAGVNADHAERCLGHVIGGVRATYDRTNSTTRRSAPSRHWPRRSKASSTHSRTSSRSRDDRQIPPRYGRAARRAVGDLPLQAHAKAANVDAERHRAVLDRLASLQKEAEKAPDDLHAQYKIFQSAMVLMQLLVAEIGAPFLKLKMGYPFLQPILVPEPHLPRPPIDRQEPVRTPRCRPQAVARLARPARRMLARRRSVVPSSQRWRSSRANCWQRSTTRWPRST